jgi:hypothetical protein
LRFTVGSVVAAACAPAVYLVVCVWSEATPVSLVAAACHAVPVGTFGVAVAAEYQPDRISDRISDCGWPFGQGEQCVPAFIFG